MIKIKSENLKVKTCTKCSKTLLITEFYKTSNKCKECAKEEQRQRNKDNKAKQFARDTNKDSQVIVKICFGCNTKKPLGLFRINRSKCIDCEKEYGRNYNVENKDIREKWASENQDKIKKLKADWYQNNKPHIQEKYNARYHGDAEFKLKVTLKKRLLSYIKKERNTVSYLGTEISLIKQWLEYNFDDNMTWDNHGSYWDIDHVFPISLFDLSDANQVYVCFNWKNLMPLSSSQNSK